MKYKIKKVICFFIFLCVIVLNSIQSIASSAPNISAESAILIENSTGKVLYGKNEEQRMFPASTTKILTAILTLENCNLNDVVTVTYDAISNIPSGYSLAALQTDEQVTVNQLLQMLMVHSANDAANALAIHISGSIENFANLMNEKVASLGLTNTHFVNPSGIHNENHYTTAHDLAIIMQYCMKNNTFRNLASLLSCSIPQTNKYEARTFYTTNSLLVKNDSNIANNRYYEYAIAGKTGFTTPAKNCLVSSARKDNLELICVVLASGTNADGSSTKFSDSKALFEYGYENYAYKSLIEQGVTAKTIDVSNATDESKSLDLVVADDISAFVNLSTFDENISPEIQIDENLSAPISQGQVVGKLSYTIDDDTYSSDLIASHSVIPARSPIIIVEIILLVIVLIILLKLLFPKKKKEF